MEKQSLTEKATISVITRSKGDNGSDLSASISIKEFLDFLKTAYQVEESLEGVLEAGGMTEAVNWLKLKENPIINKNSIDDEIDKKLNSGKNNQNKKDDEGPIKRKLSEVLSEGLLDSVLPYLTASISAQSVRSKTQIKIVQQQNDSNNEKKSSKTNLTKKRSCDSSGESQKGAVSKNVSEVEIHVCDELKNIKKDFVCNQNLLIEKMGYFAEVTNGQKLEDMDISVHCDIGIFEWLMKWVKKDSLMEEDWPQLDVHNVVPILVSAAFLQMEPLLNDCLLFVHEYMNDILKTTTNLSCLNDSILTRLAAMYTNIEVEAIKDKKDKIQSRIFTKLIKSLAEVEPETIRGHWMSLAYLFKCQKCHQLVNPEVGQKLPCVPSCMRLVWDGSIISNHIRDPIWNINDYIQKLNKSLKSWRRVYWRLWGNCHFLYCEVCKRYFPTNQIGWCRFHPDNPQFFTLDAQKAPLPVGRYPCCGERAYRFQLLQNHNGCQFREHQVCTTNVKDSAILAVLETFRNLIEEQPPQLLFPERLTRLVAKDPDSNTDNNKLQCKETFWWDGFEIIPPRPKLGLLTDFVNKNEEADSDDQPPQIEESSDESSSDDSSSSSSTSSKDSVECNPKPSKQKVLAQRKRKTKPKDSRLWQHNLSARNNQDRQRAYEEAALKQIVSLLKRKISMTDSSHRLGGNMSKQYHRNITPLGGVWVRLEAEFRESFLLPMQSRNKISLNNPKSKFSYKKN